MRLLCANILRGPTQQLCSGCVLLEQRVCVDLHTLETSQLSIVSLEVLCTLENTSRRQGFDNV